MNNFNESYYKNANYAGYLERRERYERMIQELHFDLFRKLNLDFTHSNVLDLGCAVGFVVKALYELGYKNVIGYDVSQWATQWGLNELGLKSFKPLNELRHITNECLTTNSSLLMNHKWKMVFAFDVLEHINIDDLNALLTNLSVDYMLVRIPLTSETEGKFILDVSENDPTHIMRYTRSDWHDLFKKCNFTWLFDVNVGLCYDTEGVMCAMFRKNLEQ